MDINGDTELLIKDLSCRLPYGVKAYVKNWSGLEMEWIEDVYTIESIHPSLNKIFVCSERGSVEVIVDYDDYEIQPYLIPLSSMTEEQKEEYCSLQQKVIYNSKGPVNSDVMEYVNWCYKNHIDINGLIPMGLAIDATGLNIY